MIKLVARGGGQGDSRALMAHLYPFIEGVGLHLLCVRRLEKLRCIG
jgi:hypothetical protein